MLIRKFTLLSFAALTLATAFGQTTNVVINPEADTFIRAGAPTNNYGRAGSLSVAGISATNGFGMPGGRVDSLVRFRLNDVIPAMDSIFGGHNWMILNATLHLYEQGAPNNASFSRGSGAFEIRWLASGDTWQEGTGSPNAPTMDGLSFQDLSFLLDPVRDLSLGVYTNTGMDRAVTLNLPLAPGFIESLRAGGPTTLQFTPASDSVGFTFLSRSDPRVDLRVALELTITSGPPPEFTSITLSPTNGAMIRFNMRSNWTYVLQCRDSIGSNSGDSWRNLFTAPAQPSDKQIIFPDTPSGLRRFYRLSVSP